MYMKSNYYDINFQCTVVVLLCLLLHMLFLHDRNRILTGNKIVSGSQNIDRQQSRVMNIYCRSILVELFNSREQGKYLVPASSFHEWYSSSSSCMVYMAKSTAL